MDRLSLQGLEIWLDGLVFRPIDSSPLKMLMTIVCASRGRVECANPRLQSARRSICVLATLRMETEQVSTRTSKGASMPGPLPFESRLPAMTSDNDQAHRKRAQDTIHDYLGEPTTVICLVFGASKDADDCQKEAAKQGKAASPTATRLIRIPDERVLSFAQAGEWKPRSDVLASFLTRTRRVQSAFSLPSATDPLDLLQAFLDALGNP